MRTRKTVSLHPAFMASIAGLALGPAIGVSGTALAQPQGSQVVRGDATITTTGSLTRIRAANNTILRHKSFDIAQGQTVQFIQPTAASRVLNRIDSAAPTRIDGSLLANGRVYLVNPAGVFFGQNSIVNAGALIAAAGKMSDRDFLRGVDRFTELTGDVIASGDIKSGDVVFAGSNVRVDGTIRADRSAILVSGNDVLVRQAGSSSVHVKVGTLSEGISTKRSARGLGAGDALGNQLSIYGTVQARTIHAESAGATTLTGALTTSGDENRRTTGGSINVLGERVTLTNASIDATGANAGGAINIGGAFQGQGYLRTSHFTSLDASTTINSSAATNGNAGNVVVWSDDHTDFAGLVLARGGKHGGNGALVEVSGKQTLAYAGTVRAGAEKGANGTLLLDPKNITITAAGFAGVNQAFGSNPSSNSEVDLAILLSTLAGNTNVTLQANNDINWQDGETSFFNSTATLTLQAGRSVLIDNLNNGFTKVNASGLNINIIANDSVGVTAAGTQANRDAGAGNVRTGNISPGGNVSITVRPTSGAFQAGSVTLGTLEANRLTIDTGGASVTQSIDSDINVSDLLLLSPSGANTNFNLSRIGNEVDNFAANVNGSISLAATGNMRFDSLGATNGVNSSGAVNILLAGTLSQVQPIIAPTLAVETRQNGVGDAIVLGDVANNVGSVALDSFQSNGIDNSVRAITYRDFDAVAIDGVNTAGIFTLSTGAEITQSLPIVANAGLFVTTRNNAGAGILLNTQANTSSNVGLQVLNGAGNAPANADALYKSLGAFVLSDSRTGATLDIEAGGAISGGNGATLIANLLRATTLSNLGAPITFTQSTNTVPVADLRSRNSANSADAPGTITYIAPSSLSLAGLQTSGTASLAVNGNLSQSGVIRAGVLSIDTLTNSVVTIDLPLFNFVGTLNVATRSLANPDNLVTGDIRFRDANGITLGDIRSLGNARFAQGEASTSTQSGVLRLNGLALESGSWTLTSPTNTITTLASANLLNLNFENSQGIEVGSVSVLNEAVNGVEGAGFVRLVARGAITQSRGITCDHLIARTLGGFAIDLSGANSVNRVTLESRNTANTAFDAGPITFGESGGFAVLRLGTTSTARLDGDGVVTQEGANSPIIAAGLVLGGSGDAEFTFDRTDNAFPLLAGSVRSANVFSTMPLTITTLGGFAGIDALDFLRLLSNGTITQNARLTADLLVARTLNDVGSPIVLENPDNNVDAVNFQVRNAANTAFANAPIIYRDFSGFSVRSLGTLNGASLWGGVTAAMNQAGAVAPITVSGLQTLGYSDVTFDNALNAIPLFAGTGNTINLFSTTPVNFGPIFSSPFVIANNFVRVQSRGDITQTGSITANLVVARTLSDAFTQILLTNQSNNVNQINMQSRNAANSGFGGGRIVYADTNGYSIVSLGTNEQAILRANAGEVNQTGAALPITLGQGLRLFGNGSFLLTNQNNAIPALVGNTGNTSIFTTTPLFITQLGSASGFQSTGDVSLIARGPITQNRFIRGVNLFAQTRNDAGADIILITPGNQFTGIVLQTRNAADTAFVNANAQYEEN